MKPAPASESKKKRYIQAVDPPERSPLGFGFLALGPRFCRCCFGLFILVSLLVATDPSARPLAAFQLWLAGLLVPTGTMAGAVPDPAAGTPVAAEMTGVWVVLGVVVMSAIVPNPFRFAFMPNMS